jgi:ABC-type transport system involved in multi-copper enzyme maturation permease subunit
MSVLLLVEFRRLLSRRIVRFAGGVVLLGLLIAGLVLFVRSHRLDAASTARSQAKAEAAYQEELAACSSGKFGIPPSDIPPGETMDQFCREIVQPPPIANPAFHLTQYRAVAEGLSGLLIALLIVLGATSAGAEWHAGTVTTQLTWESRRTRLLVAKVIVAGVFAFVAFLAAEALLFGALAPAALFRGTTDGIDARWFEGTVVILLRAGAVAAMGAAIGHALAWLARNTAVAVGAALGYAAVLEPLLRAARPKWEPWFLVSNAVRFITAHPLDFTTRARSTTGAGVLLAAYTVGAVIVSLAVFRRRDVT